MTSKSAKQVLSTYKTIIDSGSLTVEAASNILKEQNLKITKATLAALSTEEQALATSLGLVKAGRAPRVPKEGGAKGRVGAYDLIKVAYPNESALIEQFRAAMASKVFDVTLEDGTTAKYQMNPIFFRRVDAAAPKRAKKEVESATV